MKYKAIRNKINASVNLLRSVQKKGKALKAGGTKTQLKELNAELEKVIGIQKEMQKLKNELKARKKELGTLVKKLAKDLKKAKKAQKKSKTVKPVKAVKIVKPVKASKPVKPAKAEKSKVKRATPVVKRTVKKATGNSKVKSRARGVIKREKVVQPVVTVPPSEENAQ